MSMRSIIILLTLLFLLINAKKVIAQTGKYSISGGLNLSTPTLVFRNENNLRNTIPSLQIGLNRRFEISSLMTIKLSFGFLNNSFSAESNFINMGSGKHIKKIDMSYGYFEIDYLLNRKIRNYNYFFGVGIRGKRIIYENFSEMYQFSGLNSAGIGGNLILGFQFDNAMRKPYVQINYFYSFSKSAYNSVRVNNEIFTDELKDRSFGLVIGFNLNK